MEQVTFLKNNALKGKLEAILFAAGDAVSENNLCKILGLEKNMLVAVLNSMADDYQNENRGICLINAENTWQLASKSIHCDVIIEITGLRQSGTLSKAALETLAIIAYKQPVTKVEVDQIRGVSGSSTVRWLLDRELIEEAGRLNAPGRPILYKTTHNFLKTMGIRSIKELPDFENFEIQMESVSQEIINADESIQESEEVNSGQ